MRWKGDFYYMSACCWRGLIKNAPWPCLPLGSSVKHVATCVCTTGKAVWTDHPRDLTSNAIPHLRVCVALSVCDSVYHTTSLDYSNDTGPLQKHIVDTPKEFAANTNILNLLYKQMRYSAASCSSAADNWKRSWQQHNKYYHQLSGICRLVQGLDSFSIISVGSGACIAVCFGILSRFLLKTKALTINPASKTSFYPIWANAWSWVSEKEAVIRPTALGMHQAQVIPY